MWWLNLVTPVNNKYFEKLSYGFYISASFKVGGKEIVERRHGEPIKFLFLPKMGLLGSQAGNEKKSWL